MCMYVYAYPTAMGTYIHTYSHTSNSGKGGGGGGGDDGGLLLLDGSISCSCCNDAKALAVAPSSPAPPVSCLCAYACNKEDG